ncbi:type VII secretion-associated serine protease mycosin [Streptosporangium subroseum]|uniref:Type VII secretion-associated serine protease mycosin n=1 Tax=Streptosporangium subroseum TaxID=106412 RepID=A0A239HCV5_9ACTN|nr:S8 family serine peptidase [Streptosporangium subroseum]SNS79190.1 type VII secretion-associated serine protease mycosin [Streptosporangium subroseum]
MIGWKLAAGVLALTIAAPPVAAAGEAAGGTADCSPPRGTATIGESWAQRRLNLPEVWQLTRGAGVTVAIVDSGLDTGHPQLKRGIAEDVTGTGARDCFGHGTEVAGIVAAVPVRGVPFTGVAPEVKLISVKHTNDERGQVGMLAQAIVKAVQLGADVINVSVQASDQPDLRNAVAYALAKNVVVVAAAGNVNKDDGSPVAAYPATYPGVLSVGSAGPDGRRADSSNPITPIAVMAPGTGITSTLPGQVYKEDLEGTSFAAAYVTGVVALVRARYPELTNEEVGRRITLTADGGSGTGTGAGMVNPLLAVSAILPSETVALAPQEPAPLAPDAIRPAPEEDARSVSIATRVALFSLAAAVLITLGSITIPLGRRRGWRAGPMENGS